MELARSARRSRRRPGTLRLLHHARDLRQNGVFAQRLRAANHRSVVVKRTRQHASARLPGQRLGFAGEHGFVYGRLALENLGINREPLAGKHQHAVAGENLGQWHYFLHLVADAAGGDGAQIG